MIIPFNSPEWRINNNNSLKIRLCDASQTNFVVMELTHGCRAQCYCIDIHQIISQMECTCWPQLINNCLQSTGINLPKSKVVWKLYRKKHRKTCINNFPNSDPTAHGSWWWDLIAKPYVLTLISRCTKNGFEQQFSSRLNWRLTHLTPINQQINMKIAAGEAQRSCTKSISSISNNNKKYP